MIFYIINVLFINDNFYFRGAIIIRAKIYIFQLLMVRSIFSLCSIAVGLKKILFISLAFAIVYLMLSNFTIPLDWRSSYVSSSTQYRFPSPDDAESIIRTENNKIISTERAKLNYDDLDGSDTNLFINSVVKSTIEMPQNNSKKCSDIVQNPKLIGHIGQAPLLIEELEEWEVEKANPDLISGGNWKPENCTPLYKVAIVIPYRDRKSHLIRLLDFLIQILKRQMLDFRFILTEQKGDDLFNKGRIMNAAFRFAYEQLKVDCLIFHDVDMFPQDDRTPYGCPSMEGPRHVGAFVSSLGYQLWYQEIVGGVLAINVQQYLTVNGFSNSYWGWGGEDDDMGKRILSHNFTIGRPSSDFVRFTMLKHVKRKRLAPKLVYKLLEETEKRMNRDGVNETGKWRLEKVDVRPLYYHLLIDVGNSPNEWKS